MMGDGVRLGAFARNGTGDTNAPIRYFCELGNAHICGRADCATLKRVILLRPRLFPMKEAVVGR